LRAGDVKSCEGLADEAVLAGFDPAQVYARVVAPAMRSIGAGWQRGELTVADEHLATAITHDVLAFLFPRVLARGTRTRERVMLAAAQGEHHVLGLLMVADILEGAGFDVVYLGPDLPVDSLLAACEKHRPAVLGLSASMALNVPALLNELVQVAQLESPPLLMVGGRALLPAVNAGLRVPLVLHADQAVQTVEKLLAGGPQNPPLDDELLRRIPRGDAARSGAAHVGTVSDQFSHVALASADAARSAARRTAAMELLALRDSLTGMWNRRAFDDRFAELAEKSSDVTTLMVDVDRFKAVNDTYGHAVGDATLCRVARSILEHIRPNDFAARYGGDEFIVLLPETDGTVAAGIAERIRAGVSGDLAEPPVTVSIGLARFTGDQRLTGITVDQALYQAKSGGRNQVAVIGG
jgi:diguanylate cyclase (GGDEF)-like protein